MAWHGKQYLTGAEGAKARRRREAVARQVRLHDDYKAGLREHAPAPVEQFLRRGERVADIRDYVAGVSA